MYLVQGKTQGLLLLGVTEQLVKTKVMGYQMNFKVF